MVSKFTTQPTNKEVVDKINEIIDNLGGGGGASNLTDLGDVSITSASSGEALCYDGNDWINAPKTLVTIKDWTVQ